MRNKTSKELYEILFQKTFNQGGELFIMLWQDGRRKIAKGDCVYETDNEKELDDPEYEEYDEMAFKDLETNELFPVNYHNLPDEVWCDGKLVYKREIRMCRYGFNLPETTREHIELDPSAATGNG